MESNNEKFKSPNVSGKGIAVTFLTASIIIVIIAAIYFHFLDKAETIVSTSFLALFILIWFFIPRKQRQEINKQLEKQEKTRTGKIFRYIENYLLVCVAVIVVYSIIKWMIER